MLVELKKLSLVFLAIEIRRGNKINPEVNEGERERERERRGTTAISCDYVNDVLWKDGIKVTMDDACTIKHHRHHDLPNI